MPQTLQLSLVSHTNVGKTTLARTLLGRDVGEVRDEAHVTLSADIHDLVVTPQGDRLALWDTPGFGDSTRLAQRLEHSGNPLGWFLAQVWDRYRDRALWSSQQAVRNIRDHADVVLYLVNAAENPRDAGYVAAEMRVLEWCAKPVIVLLNQLGAPRPAADEQADVERWRVHLADTRCVRGVLAFDAFARCWVQEAVLFGELAKVTAADKQDAFARLNTQWFRQRREIFDAALDILAERLARAACDRETLPDGGWSGKLREIATTVGLRREAHDSPRQRAMHALAQRLDADIRASSDRLIALHGLKGHASAEILTRLADHFAVREPLSEAKSAALGGVITGALAGLKADLASGGMTFGAGLLVGGVLGALGSAGLARGYNLVRGADATTIAWTDDVLNELAASALLGYLAVAHYGRGRGDWARSEYPAHWQDTVTECLARQPALNDVWARRSGSDEAASMAPQLRAALAVVLSAVLQRLYPAVPVAYHAPLTAPALRGNIT